MIRKIGKLLTVHVAVISHKRPHNVRTILQIVGECTFYVNKGEKKEYHDAGAKYVVECGTEICTARNYAIADAHLAQLPSIQVSDDLRGIKRISVMGGKRVQVEIDFIEVVITMVQELRRRKFYFGGVAVSNNALNYQGKDISYNKLIVNDLICIMPGINQRFDVDLALKEDYDMTINQLIYVGGVVRLDNILCNFPHRENKGGANTYRNEKTELVPTKKLFAKWGPHVMKHKTREGQVSLNYKQIKETRAQIVSKKK
jgi:hypothetical protein